MCPTCEGKRGRYSYGRRVSKWIKCPTCDGTGEVPEPQDKGPEQNEEDRESGDDR